MNALLLAALFVVIGLTVVVLALRGGPRGTRETLHTQSRGGRRAVGVAAGLIIALFGIVVPGLVLADNNANRDKRGPGGVELNAAQTEGRVLFAENCSTCHTLKASNAVGKVGTNLDKLRPAKGLTVNAIEKGRARGKGQMPAELLQGEDVEQVADYVAAVAGR